MRVTLTSDGTPKGTSLHDADGRAIEGITSLRWAVDREGPSRIEAELLFVPVDRVSGVATMIGPSGKAVRRIEYADGSVDEYPEG